MATPHVFSDPSGRRWRYVRRAGAVAGLAAGAATTVFVISLLAVPLLPQLPGLSGPVEHPPKHILPVPPSKESRLSRFLLKESRLALWREVEAARRKPPKPVPKPLPSTEPVVAAFYAPWEETGLHSLRAHAPYLTHLMPEWLHITPSGSGLDTTDWDPDLTPHNLDVVQIARDNGVRIQPILNNAQEGVFDPLRAHRLLRSPAAQRALAAQVRDFLVRNKFQGLNLDLENLNDADYAYVPGFARLLGGVLREAGLSLSADVETSRIGPWIHGLAGPCDFLVVMMYDEHYEGGDPGPIASAGWFYDRLHQALRHVPSQKLVAGLGNYAYDWQDGKAEADAISYQSALLLAQDNHPDEPVPKIIDFDSDALNPTFTYEDDDNHFHTVWMLDAITAYNQWRLARQEQVRGAAVWVLGEEDPGVWDFLRRKGLLAPPRPRDLETVDFPYDIDFEGEGELLAISSTPREGRREIEVDGETGLITDEVYHAFPSSFVINREGYTPGQIVLSFDDGPDPTWTPKILDVLKENGVHGAFFVIGENAERYPDLVRRIWREGNEIGNHTFSHPNLAAVSHRRAVLELNTTQRALQSIIGRSTILFRAPYNADAEPVSAEEVKPIQIASDLGYVTVGEIIDPQDWNLFEPGPNGTQVARTTKELVDFTLRQVRIMHGNVILMHDGGGDRSHTVEALEQLIPRLKRAGYHFTTLAQLLGKSRDTLMPPLGEKDHLLIGFDRVVFYAIYYFEAFLQTAFIVAITLGLGRVVLLVPIALLAAYRSRRQRWDPDFRPAVSVLIAAYNEQPVIARTLQSILESDYPVLEVVVVDDGSKDDTAGAVAERFGSDPRVRVIRQANGGKAAALNRAVGEAKGEILVCLDADTQVMPTAVGRLVRHFQDPKVASVAGNVKVGNPVNVITRWQLLEYVTSQNLDRRAYSLMNAVSVVPGAAGAWRREAVLAAGGYPQDNMAEDMDLTWRLRRAGWKVTSDQAAVALTEAPQTLPAFFRQRFRWTYGTLQCLWKHKAALGRYGWFGRFTLPTLWLFQVFFQVLAPLVDLQVLYTLAVFFRTWLLTGMLTRDWQPLPNATHILFQTLFFYALFFAVDLLGGLVAFMLDREPPWPLWLLFLQRFVYRQIIYAVLWKSLAYAVKGASAGWGKTERKGTVVAGGTRRGNGQ